MAFSLSNWFKGKSGAAADAAAKTDQPAPASPAPAKPAATASSPMPRTAPSVRKVVPNSVQPVSLRDPGMRSPVSLPVGAPTSTSAPARPLTNLMPPRRISLGNPAAASAHPPAPGPAAPPPPPAPAPAYEPAPMPDVTVSLQVGDFIDRIPPTLLAAEAADRGRQVEFRSSELYSDLTKGRASVPASVIYEKCPDLFSRPVSDTEDAEVPLPLAKLVEQLTPALQTRTDQVAEENVGEIETPFLQVAMEDNARLPTAAGTTAGAIRPATPLPAAPPAVDLPPRPLHRTGQIQTISAPKVVSPAEPVVLPTASAAPAAGPINPGKRPPSTVRASVAGGKIRLSGPSMPNRISVVPSNAVTPPDSSCNTGDRGLPPSATQRIATPMPPLPTSATSPSHQVTKKTQRIQIPPISLRSAPGPLASPSRPPGMPPSVPVQPSPVTVRQPVGEPSAPVTFRSSPPPVVKPPPQSFAPPPTRPSFPPPAFPAMPPLDASPTPTPAPVPPPAPVADSRRIALGLAAVLRGLSSSLLAVEPSAVPDDVKISLPFALIEPQMKTGRVSVPRAVFIDALPDGHKDVLDAGADFPDVPLPLQEVFMNLPSNALTMRDDQVQEEIGHLYPTPFSQKAEEDAQRLGIGEVPPTAAVAMPALPTDRPLPTKESVKDEKVADELPALVPDQPKSDETARDILLDPEDRVAESLEETPGTAVKAQAETHAPEEAVSYVEEAPEAKAEPAPEPVPVAEKIPEAAPASAFAVPGDQPASRPVPVVAKGKDSELQVLFMTEEELDAKTVVRFVTQMPGLDGCTVMFGDGLRLAGNFPDDDQVEGFSAMAPPFFKRAKNFALESGMGTLQAFTFYTDDAPCSFLMHEDICLAVRHSSRGFMPGVREKLEVVVRELARMYS